MRPGCVDTETIRSFSSRLQRRNQAGIDDLTRHGDQEIIRAVRCHAEAGWLHRRGRAIRTTRRRRSKRAGYRRIGRPSRLSCGMAQRRQSIWQSRYLVIRTHVSIDRRFGFIRRWAATDAAAYEGRRLRTRIATRAGRSNSARPNRARICRNLGQRAPVRRRVRKRHFGSTKWNPKRGSISALGAQSKTASLSFWSRPTPFRTRAGRLLHRYHELTLHRGFCRYFISVG